MRWVGHDMYGLHCRLLLYWRFRTAHQLCLLCRILQLNYFCHTMCRDIRHLRLVLCRIWLCGQRSAALRLHVLARILFFIADVGWLQRSI